MKVILEIDNDALIAGSSQFGLGETALDNLRHYVEKNNSIKIDTNHVCGEYKGTMDSALCSLILAEISTRAERYVATPIDLCSFAHCFDFFVRRNIIGQLKNNIKEFKSNVFYKDAEIFELRHGMQPKGYIVRKEDTITAYTLNPIDITLEKITWIENENN